MDLEYNFQARYQEVIEIVNRKEKGFKQETARYNALSESCRKKTIEGKERIEAARKKIPYLKRQIEDLEKRIARGDDKYERTRAQVMLLENVHDNNLREMRTGDASAQKVMQIVQQIKSAKMKLSKKEDEYINNMRLSVLRDKQTSACQSKLDETESKIKRTEEDIAFKKKLLQEVIDSIPKHEKNVESLAVEMVQKSEGLAKQQQRLMVLTEKSKKITKMMRKKETELQELAVKFTERRKQLDNAEIKKLHKVTKTDYKINQPMIQTKQVKRKK